MPSYPGSRDASRRPSLTTLPYFELMAEMVGRVQADLAALRADIEAVDDEYALVYVDGLGGIQFTLNGGAPPFQPPQEAKGVQVPLGGPWRTAWVGPTISGNWYNQYYASAIGFYADNGAANQVGLIGQADLLWVDNTGYTQVLEQRSNVVPIWPGTTEFRLEQNQNLSMGTPDPKLILPIPVWFTRRAVSNDVSLQGY